MEKRIAIIMHKKPLFIIVLICLSITGCANFYNYRALKEVVTTYNEYKSKRIFLNKEEDVPEYIEITLLTKDNLINEIKELIGGFSREERLGIVHRSGYFADVDRYIKGKDSKFSKPQRGLSPKSTADIIKRLSNIKKVIFKVTLWGKEPFLSEHEFVFSLADNINPYFKEYKIEYIKKFSRDDVYLFDTSRWVPPAMVYSEVFLIIFDYFIEPEIDYLTLFIDGRYRTSYDFEKGEPRYNTLHKEVTFNLKN
jgi:hypothetical protein